MFVDNWNNDMVTKKQSDIFYRFRRRHEITQQLFVPYGYDICICSKLIKVHFATMNETCKHMFCAYISFFPIWLLLFVRLSKQNIYRLIFLKWQIGKWLLGFAILNQKPLIMLSYEIFAVKLFVSIYYAFS